VAAHCDLFKTNADILRAAMRAIENPEVAGLAAQSDGHRRRAIDQLASGWNEAGVPRRSLAPQTAADRLWLLTTVEGYLNAVDRLGWSPEEYEIWLGDLAQTELLEPER
jgi:hypothetical protein